MQRLFSDYIHAVSPRTRNPSPLEQFVLSGAYAKKLEQLEGDAEEAVRITCALLDHFALSPSQGLEVADFFPEGRHAPILLQLVGVSNWVGCLVLQNHPAAYAQLREAVARNLQSSRFRAAILSTKMSARLLARCSAAQARATAAYKKTMRLRSGGLTPELRKDRAFLAYAAELNPVYCLYQTRIARLNKATTTPGFHVGAPSRMALFIEKHLLPSSTPPLP